MSFLYIGTFGSFIGYSAAFPLLIKSQFPEQASAWSTPGLPRPAGRLAGPAGRRLAVGPAGRRPGDARGTSPPWPARSALVWHGLASRHSFVLFFGAYMLLFATTGVGNGSTYRMIPAIFRAKATAGIDPPAHRLRGRAAVGRRDASAAIGIISAVGAFGGFFINRGFGSSIAATGGAGAALAAFATFYVVCAVVTWACYLRTVGPVPSLAAARV